VDFKIENLRPSLFGEKTQKDPKCFTVQIYFKTLPGFD